MNALHHVRKKSPLILNLTNYVAMDLTANALLAIGASPIMAHAREEIEELVKVSQAVVINIGTLDSNFIQNARLAAEKANQYFKPVILDPVGSGATHYRTDCVRTFLRDFKIASVRGNASEISSIFANTNTSKGVDSTICAENIVDLVQKESINSHTVFTISGKTDYILSQGEKVQVERGDPMMTQVTAMGCTATCMIGAFTAILDSPFQAAVEAMTVMGLAGEIAKKNSTGTGSFRAAFLDALSSL